MTAQASSGCRTFACTADRIFDGSQTHTNAAVIITDDRVDAIMPTAALPPGLPLQNAPGCTILPGLIDIHVHFMRWQGPCFLSHGVTTIRDTGNALEWILERRRESPDRPWPRILCQGPLLEGPTPYHPLVSRRNGSVGEAVIAVRETLAAGADDIKLYVGIPPAWVGPMMQACHALGHKAAMEVGAGGLLAAARAGMDEFFHFDGLIDDIWPGHPPGWIDLWGHPDFDATWDNQQRAADEIRRLGVTMTPTLAYVEAQARLRQGPAASAGRISQSTSPRADVVPALIRQWQSTSPDANAAQRWMRSLAAAQRFIGLLLERGVPVLAGTDVPFGAITPGLSLWHELGLLVEAGMTPVQALRSATADAAAFLRRPDLGRIAQGTVADLVVMRGNPLAAIPRYPEIVQVIRNGEQQDPSGILSQMESLTDPATPGPGPNPPDPWTVQLANHARRNG